ncbi:MAG: class I SAM-dependent methyltransferase [bacterium]|nr:class I SAM-dependent methyltransferase [bacterium]
MLVAVSKVDVTKVMIWNDFYKQKKGVAVWGGERADFFLELIKKYKLSGGLLLDIGCGVGDKSIFFAKNGFETVGIDISEVAITEAREKAKSAGAKSEFFVGDFSALAKIKEIAARRYDVVLDLLSSQFLIGDEKSSFIEQLAEVQASGGYYFFETFGKESEDDPMPGVEEWIKKIAVSPQQVEVLYGSYFEILERIVHKSGNQQGASVHFYVMRRK